jgi:peptidoglycan hydrolase CwlO-like protein
MNETKKLGMQISSFRDENEHLKKQMFSLNKTIATLEEKVENERDFHFKSKREVRKET